MIELSLKLLIAHLLGDFVLQPDAWIKAKEKDKLRSPYLYFHILIHTAALLVLLEFDFSYWKGLVIIVTSHFIIDAVKLHLSRSGYSRLLFAADQMLHLAVLTAVVHVYEPFNILPDSIFSAKALLLVAAIIAVSFLSSVLIKLLLAGWDIKEDSESESLKNAGKYIGILERLFVFGFIVLSQWQAVGLLIAAKSVFRFSDLSRSKDRKLTEYILIGTLLSFGLAVFFGLMYKYGVRLID